MPSKGVHYLTCTPSFKFRECARIQMRALALLLILADATALALYFRRSPFSSFLFRNTHIMSITSGARLEISGYSMTAADLR
eukprot:2446184-Pleurochrysis_carterae.AAC.1